MAHYPTAKEIDRLLDEVGQELGDRLRERGVSEHGAMTWIMDALFELTYRWDQIANRGRWLLEHLERNHPEQIRQETEDDRPTPTS